MQGRDRQGTHPRNETLVEANDTTARPDGLARLPHCLRPVGGHLGLKDLEGLAEGSDLEEVQTSAEQQVGELDGLLLQMRIPNGSGNVCDGNHGFGDDDCDEGPDQGRSVLLRGMEGWTTGRFSMSRRCCECGSGSGSGL